MSSFPSAGDTRVPAWKRLGLKLKPASDEQSQKATLLTSSAAAPMPNHYRENPTGPVNGNSKRKSSGVPALDHSAKKAKRDASQSQIPSTQTPKKAKSVSFAAEPTQEAGSPATTNGTQVRNKQKSTPIKKTIPTSANPAKKQAPVNLEPALAYLRQWHTSKDTWKFNKNNQTKLLEQVFADEFTIPAADIHIFYEYIRGLKGAVRTRLKELASGIKAQDMEQGSSLFTGSNKDIAERKQKEYEAVIAAFLNQPRITGKRRFDEVDYVLRTSDIEMQRRVVKRMRCENVLDELSDIESTETASTATATTSPTGKESSAGDSEHAISEGALSEAEGVQRLRLNDGPQQRVKRKRKLRTAIVEDTSSESESESESENESDSDSGSDSSSSGSSSSEDSEDDIVQPQLHNEADTSSSSSSSSEASEADSDSDADDDDD
ncbi:hypothetical protein K449DRAFT_393384 [Hypoxylon sp. EC38]|nr:hypothetical protein K449DRAFT_393384 [Hypoxylon sp. EC38]